MTVASANPFPYMQYVEQGSTPSSPAAGSQRLFVRTSDHILCMVNSSGAVTALSGSLTNPMTTTGDIIVGGASGVPARLAIGAANTVLLGGTTPAYGGFSGCAAYNSAAQNVTNGSQDVITLDSELWDTDTYHSTASNTGRLVVPTTAKYRVIARAFWNTGGTNNTGCYLTLFKNGEGATTVYGGQAIGANLNSDGGQIGLELTVALTAADYLEMKFYNTTGGTRAVGHATNNSQRSYFEIQRILGT